MTHDEMIAVIQAHKEGKVIEVHSKSWGGEAWTDVKSPMWNFALDDYRIKPEPKFRPWKTVDEVPVGQYVAGKTSGDRYLIAGAQVGLSDPCRLVVLMGLSWTSPADLLNLFVMQDGSPCGVKE